MQAGLELFGLDAGKRGEQLLLVPRREDLICSCRWKRAERCPPTRWTYGKTTKKRSHDSTAGAWRRCNVTGPASSFGAVCGCRTHTTGSPTGLEQGTIHASRKQKLTSLTDQQNVALLTAAAQWQLISRLLAWPHGDWRQQTAELTREIDDESLLQAAAAAIITATEGLSQPTFGRGGPAAPREVSHREYLLPGQSLAELQACYDAFAYVVAEHLASIAQPLAASLANSGIDDLHGAAATLVWRVGQLRMRSSTLRVMRCTRGSGPCGVV